METKTRNPLLAGAATRAWSCTRLLVAGVCALSFALPGCSQRASTKEPAASPSLADRLDAMPAQAQLDTLRTLARENPADATFAFHTGNAYYVLGGEQPEDRHSVALAYFDSATAAYRRATEIDTTYARAFVNMGLAYDAGRKSNEARAAFRRAIEIDPKDVLAYCHLGYLEFTAGNRADAMQLYGRALAIDPNSAQAHYNLGLAFADAKIFHEALAEWDRVVELDPQGELGRIAADNVRIIRQYLAETP
jgi:tetratricopeptide (TPR) repeat protein